jgi:outer membrane autotransporter protein
MLSFKLVYDGTDGETWYLALDSTESSEALANLPFAARNLFKLATESVSDRLDEVRSAYASLGMGSAPLGYAPSPTDPVTAALAVSTPAPATSSAWVKTAGRYGKGDGYDNLSGSIEAGIDTLVDTGSGTVAIGAFAGTGAAKLGFDLADTDATLSGPLVGAYANYATGRAFFGAIAAAQSLNVDATISGAETSFGGLTYGGRVDAGYRFGDQLIIEPAVALAASHTEFDTFEMNAMDVGFYDTDSLSAEARVKIARDFAADGVTVTPFAVATIGNDFLGGDGVSAPASDVVTGNNGGLYGDLSGGITVANDDATLSGFAKGNLGYASGELSGGVKLGANAAF